LHLNLFEVCLYDTVGLALRLRLFLRLCSVLSVINHNFKLR